MLDIAVLDKAANQLSQVMPWVSGISSPEPSIAMLRVIIDQHQLTLSDFKEEIGAKSTVSIILSGKRSLTLNHIKALSVRFGVPASLFIGS